MVVRTVIEIAEGTNIRVVSDHIINLLQEIKGSLKNDKDNLPGYIILLTYF